MVADETQATAIMALLQPSPEVFKLFDDVLLLSEGACVYHGPREGALPFLESQGFRCPLRMPVPGFLQNITSRRDQEVTHLLLHGLCLKVVAAQADTPPLQLL